MKSEQQLIREVEILQKQADKVDCHPTLKEICKEKICILNWVLEKEVEQ